jgi:hypothetical protein
MFSSVCGGRGGPQKALPIAGFGERLRLSKSTARSLSRRMKSLQQSRYSCSAIGVCATDGLAGVDKRVEHANHLIFEEQPVILGCGRQGV